MIMEVYAVYDSAVEAYMPPFFCRARGEAVRSFTDLVNDGKSSVWKYPEHYFLYHLSTYDDKLGVFSVGTPVRVVAAVDVAAEVSEAQDSWAGRAGKLRS